MNDPLWQNPFMQQALALAAEAAQKNEVPVGAVVVKDGAVIAATHNLTLAAQDPTAHAEMLAIREACQKLGTNHLTDCTLYVTLEPCAMCAQAIAHARVGTLVYAASDPKGGGVEHGPRIFTQPTCHHTPEVFSGIGAAEAGALLRDFFRDKRA